ILGNDGSDEKSCSSSGSDEIVVEIPDEYRLDQSSSESENIDTNKWKVVPRDERMVIKEKEKGGTKVKKEHESLLDKRERERVRNNSRNILDEQVGKSCDARKMICMNDSITKRRTTNEETPIADY
ncbi:hypothetical protein FRX31_034658, partial [Thalictrum thalictroides]